MDGPAIRALLPLLALLLAGAPAAQPASEPYGPGDRLPDIELPDQFGEPHRIGESTRVLLFSRDMQAGEILSQALSDVGADVLAERQVLYVSDLSGMPGFVTSWMALPALRDRAYPILVDREGEPTARYPAERGRPTLLFLDALRIVRVESPESAPQTRTLLGLDDGHGPR